MKEIYVLFAIRYFNFFHSQVEKVNISTPLLISNGNMYVYDEILVDFFCWTYFYAILGNI